MASIDMPIARCNAFASIGQCMDVEKVHSRRKRSGQSLTEPPRRPHGQVRFNSRSSPARLPLFGFGGRA